MKKRLAVFIAIFISVLSFSIYHATANVFPGNLTGGTATEGTNTGSLVVTGVPSGTLIRIYDYNTRLRTEYSATAGQAQTPIPNVKPGQYYATYTDAAGVESDPSNMAEVLPPPVSVSKESPGAKTITVSNAIPSAEVRLYSENNAVLPISRRANTSGIAIFENLPTGKNYRAIQVINGAASAPSAEGVDIIPDQVDVLKERDSGPDNNQGSIQVFNATLGHTLEIYNVQNRQTPAKPPVALETTTTYYFNDLPAGTYVVVQKKDGLVSIDSDPITIGDEKAPVITLNGPAKIEMETSYQNPGQFVDPGFTATDNIDGVITNAEFLSTSIEPLLPSPIYPGSYVITYTARDRAGNTATATRELVIRPNTVSLSPKNTSSKEFDDAFGEIEVVSAFPGATLYLYQDGSNQLVVAPIKASNEGTYTIENIPVGTKYYVIQEINGIQSNPSKRVDILDKTPPQLFLNGDASLNLTAGEEYTELGAWATDNIDARDSLNVVIGGDRVNTDQPGVYEVTYNVTDAAKNRAEQITRKIIVEPRAVTAYGSTADIGQIGVSNIMPSSTRIPVELFLYKYEGSAAGGGVQVAKAEITTGETSYVFTKPDPDKPDEVQDEVRLAPGQYYVVQVINNQVSSDSNTVEIVDNDRPYIELNGQSKYSFVWNTRYPQDEDEEALFTSNNSFIDPFGTASDYVDGNITNQIQCTIAETEDSCYETGTKEIKFKRPGSYQIVYNVTTRGTSANEKIRTITVAPAKTGTIEAKEGLKKDVKNRIVVPDVFKDKDTQTKTTVTLYNAYGQKLKETTTNTGEAAFNDVPAGRGYYVTQTFAKMESARSNAVTIRSASEDDEAKFISIGSFSFKSPYSVGEINQEAGTITVTVPAGTSLYGLVPTFTTEGSNVNRTVRVGSASQVSGQSTQSFATPVVYTVSDGTLTKSYVVTVKTAAGSGSTVWKDTIPKEIAAVTTEGASATLTPSEVRVGGEKGASFFAPEISIHVPGPNILEASAPTLTVKKVSAYLFLNWRDPDWVDDLSDMTEITWGGKDMKFMQPIEVEMKGSANQTFVRLVRDNDKLFAIAQPSEIVNGKMVGFAQQSGIYAVLDRTVTKPAIVEGDTHRIYSSMPNAKIYYTTNSQDVGFYRSGRNADLSSYTLDGSPGDLSHWTEYVNGFTAPGQKVFAFAVSGQIVTPLVTAVPYEAADWKETVPTVSVYKTWNITFSQPIERKALYSGAIYVTDASGKKAATALNLSNGNKTLSITPKQGYQRNQQYTLWIRNEVKNSTSDGTFLKESIKLTFTVK